MTAAIVGVALLAVIAAAALIGVTLLPRAASVRATRAAVSVRLADAMQRNLLLHGHVQDRAARAQIADRLREQIDAARSQSTTQHERDVVGVADAAVSTYLIADAATSPRSGVAGRYAEAFAALDKLVAVEADEAQRASATVRRYDDAADAIGASVVAVVVAAAALMVWWLRVRALQPLFDLALKMQLFGEGRIEERARVEGPAELAGMARRFNEMASAIARQRDERHTLIAGVAHDLRNPLSAVRMSTAVLRREAAEMRPEAMTNVLGVLERQVDRLDRMVGDLLDSESIEAGNVRLRLEDHDARAIAREIAALCAPTTDAHRIELDVPPGPVPLRCDVMRIEQVLSNLVCNAIKYSPSGGRISLEVQTRDRHVAFVVRDDGVGMSEEDAARAFEPFQRSAALCDGIPGSGLGLFVVRRLVEAHGGRVDLHTAPGMGSTFEVHIPTSPVGP